MRRSTRATLFLFSLALCAPTATTQAVAAPEAAPKPQSQSAATAHPFLWRIDGLDDGRGYREFQKKSWLYGTMHLGDDRLVKLPAVVERALDNADAVYCELALDQIDQLKMTKMMLLPKGEKLSKVLPEDVYAKLDRHLQRLGTSAKRFDQMKVWAVTILMAQLEAAKHGMLKSLDMTLYTTAKQDDKEVGGLETIDEQMHAIGGTAIEDQIAMLRESLDYMAKLAEEGKSGLVIMLEAYLTGSETELLDVIDAAMGDDADLNQRIMKPMLDDRNIRMTNRIAEKLAKNPDKSYFFAVGAAHYIGDVGMITLLRKKGYRITRIQPPLPSWDDVVKMRTELQELREEVKRLKKQLEAARK